jgi:uncharacterized Zn finger protein (UPF0148 family)
MLIYKCNYCGSEYEFDGSNTNCPRCGAAFDLTANKKRVKSSTDDTSDTLDDDRLNDEADESDETSDEEKLLYTLAEVQSIVAAATDKRAKRSKIKTVITAVIAVPVLGLAALAVAGIIYASGGSSSSGSYGGSSSFEYFTETGHKVGEAFTTAVFENTDLSLFNSSVSWTKEPTLQWGEKDYEHSSNQLYITGRIHNNTDSDIKYVSLEFDLFDKDGNEIDTVYPSCSDLLANQDELMGDPLYLDLPYKYSDIATVKLVKCSVTLA